MVDAKFMVLKICLVIAKYVAANFVAQYDLLKTPFILALISDNSKRAR